MASHIQEYSEAVVSRLEGAGTGIDIGVVMELVLTLIDGCFETKEQLNEAAKDPDPLQVIGMRIIARRTLRQNNKKRPKPTVVKQLVDEMLAELAETKDEDVKAAFAEAQHGLGPFASAE